MLESSDTQLNEQVVVGTSDDVGTYEFAYATSGISASGNSGFHAADVAFDDHSEEATACLNLFNEFDVCRFRHGIGSLYAADITFGFNESECCTHNGILLMELLVCSIKII